MATSFSGGGSRSTRREPPTLGKQLVNFITCGCESSAPLFVIYKAVSQLKPWLVTPTNTWHLLFNVLVSLIYCSLISTERSRSWVTTNFKSVQIYTVSTVVFWPDIDIYIKQNVRTIQRNYEITRCVGNDTNVRSVNIKEVRKCFTLFFNSLSNRLRITNYCLISVSWSLLKFTRFIQGNNIAWKNLDMIRNLQHLNKKSYTYKTWSVTHHCNSKYQNSNQYLKA